MMKSQRKRMMKSQRLKSIEEYVLTNEAVTLDALCNTFNISKSTLRRDIDELVKRGRIKKIYGGVMAENKNLIPFKERNMKNRTKKMAIAEKAAQFVNNGDIIYIDSGTTTVNMINFLKDKNVTILTNNLDVIVNAQPLTGLNIISIGGTLSRKTNSFYGVTSLITLKNYNLKKAFMAATGISLTNGVTNSSPLEYEIKKSVVEKSDEVFLLVDSSKFGVSSLMTYCQLTEIDNLITDDFPPHEYIEFFRQNDIQLIVAK